MAEFATHLVDSVHHLSFPEEIIQNFNTIPIGSECRVRYENSLFHIRAPRQLSEEALSFFCDVFKKYVEAQVATKPLDAFEIPKVARKAGTVIADDITAVYAVEPESGMAMATSQNGNLIFHDSIIRVFETSPSAEFTTKTLSAVEKLTGCTLSIDGAGENISVMGDNATDVEGVLRKLTVISLKQSLRASQVNRFDLYMPETEINFMSFFKQPDRVIDRRIPILCPSFLLQYFEIQMVKWNATTKEFCRVAATSTASLTATTVSHPWKSYEYPGLGNAEDALKALQSMTVATPSLLPAEQTYNVAAWSRSIPQKPDDAFASSSFESQRRESVAICTGAPPTAIRTRLMVREKSQELRTDDVEDIQGFGVLVDAPPIKEPHIPVEFEWPADDISYSRFVQEAKPSCDTQTPPYQETSNLIDHPEPLQSISTAPSSSDLVDPLTDAEPIRNKEVTSAVSCHRAAESLIDLGNAEEELLPPALLPAPLLPVPMLPAPLLPAPENQQLESERSSRTYRKTLLLRAPTPNTLSVKTRIAPIKQRVCTAVSRMLGVARTSYGQLALEVVIGRIYVEKSGIGSDRFIDQINWPSAFQVRDGETHAPTIFARALTTSWTDAHFILDLKLRNNISLFSKSLSGRVVKYVVNVINQLTRQEFVIEVDQNGTHIIYNTPQLIGSANLHFTKRTWDASIQLTESTPAILTSSDPINSIVDNLWVRSGPLIAMGGSISDPDLIVTSVTVHRKTSYECLKTPSLLLHLTEVQELVLPPGDGARFEGYCAPETLMVQDDNRIWWEASITSKTADQMLKENLTLELGEIAKWTLEDFSNMNIVGDLFDLAEHVVTRIDVVGQNEKGISFGKSPSTAKSPSKVSKVESKAKYQSLEWTTW